MNKKIIAILMIPIILFTLTGCGKKDDEKNSNKEYFIELDYETLLEAKNSDEDAFIVFIYSKGVEGYELMNTTVEDYAKETKSTIYKINANEYISSEWTKNKDEYMTEYQNYKENTCLVPVYDEMTGEQLESDEYYESYDEEYCLLEYESITKEKISASLYKNFGVEGPCSLSFIRAGYILGYYNNPVNLDYYNLSGSDKDNFEKKEKQNIITWLTKAFNNESMSADE